METGLFSTSTVLTLNAQGIPAETLHHAALVIMAVLALLAAYVIRGYFRYQTMMNVIASIVILAGIYKVWDFDTYTRAFIEMCDEECQKVINPNIITECRRHIARDFSSHYVHWRVMPFGGVFDGLEYNNESNLVTLYTTRLRVGDHGYDANCTIDTTMGSVLMAEYSLQEIIVPPVE